MGITRNLNLDAHRRRVAKMTLEIGADGVRPIGGGESVQMPLHIPNDAGPALLSHPWQRLPPAPAPRRSAAEIQSPLRSDRRAATAFALLRHPLVRLPNPAPAPPIDRAGAHA